MSPISVWLQDALERVFPRSEPRETKSLTLPVARGERISFQVCARSTHIDAVEVSVALDAPVDVETRIRRVGYVPVPHHSTQTEPTELDGVGHIPGLVPDPLFEGDTACVGPLETQAFWITVRVANGCEPGPCELNVRVLAGEEEAARLAVRLDVYPVAYRPMDDFPVTHWFYADALFNWYGVEPWDERFWAIVRPYVENLVSHGSNCLYVPIFTPPVDGIKRPSQLLRVNEPEAGKYVFDFSDVRRWIRMGRESGARFFEWTHLFPQGSIGTAIRVYRSNHQPDSLLWPIDTPSTSPTFRNFLEQFLPAFRHFLDAEGVLNDSFFHICDEPPLAVLDTYRAVRAMVRELAPWMRVCDALSDVEYGREGLTDIPIPILSSAPAYAEANIPAWTYFCCGPRGPYLNRLMDTPLAKIRMTGWLLHRLEALGFLHWGYNYWLRGGQQEMIDPFTESAAGNWPAWPYGDPFVVYPGPHGPIDSVRWVVFAESLQDLALLRAAGIERNDPMLKELKDYAEFPKSAEWIRAARRTLLERASA